MTTHSSAVLLFYTPFYFVDEKINLTCHIAPSGQFGEKTEGREIEIKDQLDS